MGLVLGRLLRPGDYKGLVRGPGGTQVRMEPPDSGLLSIRAMAVERVGAGCLALAGHRTELVGGWGHQEGKNTVVAGAGLPGRHREAEVLQEAGEEEEELHAGQGLPEACAAACGWARGLCEPGSPPPRTLRMGKQTRHPLTLQVPAEKGMKASCLTKRPWASRKCSGWKQKGFSQMVSSFSTDDRLVMSVVPWWQMSGMGGSRLVRGCPDPATKHTWHTHRVAHTQTLQVTLSPRRFSALSLCPWQGALTSPQCPGSNAETRSNLSSLLTWGS